MSAPTSFETDPHTEIDAERGWSVHRCAHGCFHLAMDRMTLTLTDEEFHALQILMRHACLRLHRCGLPPADTGRAH